MRSVGSSARSWIAEVGETSRPSVKAWIHVFSGAKRSSARRWSMCEWTPPEETSPSRCVRSPRSNAPRQQALDERVRLLRELRGGRLAGADRPDRLVRDHEPVVVRKTGHLAPE